ncbi:hypothetical protein MBLNU457_3628t2 [Dothideomycetes sp. NU457]
MALEVPIASSIDDTNGLGSVDKEQSAVFVVSANSKHASTIPSNGGSRVISNNTETEHTCSGSGAGAREREELISQKFSEGSISMMTLDETTEAEIGSPDTPVEEADIDLYESEAAIVAYGKSKNAGNAKLGFSTLDSSSGQEVGVGEREESISQEHHEGGSEDDQGYTHGPNAEDAEDGEGDDTLVEPHRSSTTGPTTFQKVDNHVHYVAMPDMMIRPDDTAADEEDLADLRYIQQYVNDGTPDVSQEESPLEDGSMRDESSRAAEKEDCPSLVEDDENTPADEEAHSQVNESRAASAGFDKHKDASKVSSRDSSAKRKRQSQSSQPQSKRSRSGMSDGEIPYDAMKEGLRLTMVPSTEHEAPSLHAESRTKLLQELRRPSPG